VAPQPVVGAAQRAALDLAHEQLDVKGIQIQADTQTDGTKNDDKPPPPFDPGLCLNSFDFLSVLTRFSHLMPVL
jgi:hypothetical protein